MKKMLTLAMCAMAILMGQAMSGERGRHGPPPPGYWPYPAPYPTFAPRRHPRPPPPPVVYYTQPAPPPAVYYAPPPPVVYYRPAPPPPRKPTIIIAPRRRW